MGGGGGLKSSTKNVMDRSFEGPKSAQHILITVLMFQRVLDETRAAFRLNPAIVVESTEGRGEGERTVDGNPRPRKET